MNIIRPSSPMRNEPNELAKLETECLFGEPIEVLDNYKEWEYCKLLTDNYCGWILKINLGYMEPITHRVISNRSFIYKNNNLKSDCVHHLPLGAQLSINEHEDNWAKIKFINFNSDKIGYIPNQHIVPINNKFIDWVKVAERLLDTPYKWGGRDSIGLDCSALLQLSYQTYGENIPRNSIDQLMLKKQLVNDFKNLNRGSVIFWQGHVGIMADKQNCIHANAYHMKVTKEPLIDIISRIGNENRIIKMMNFN